jgi:hypothetical protein
MFQLRHPDHFVTVRSGSTAVTRLLDGELRDASRKDFSRSVDPGKIALCEFGVAPRRPAQRTGKNGQSDNLSLRGGKQLGEPFPVRKESLKYVLAYNQIFLTGSSSHRLAREMAAGLRGRSVSYEVFPLSFAEFLAFNGLKHEPYSRASENRMAAALADYLLQLSRLPGRVLPYLPPAGGGPVATEAGDEPQETASRGLGTGLPFRA